MRSALSTLFIGAVAASTTLLDPAAGRAQQTLVDPARPVVVVPGPTVVGPAPTVVPAPTVSEPQAPAVASPPVVVVPAQPTTPQQALTAPLKGVVKELRSGPLLIHGNYCGIGNRPGTLPIDALDAACMRHDACTKTGSLPGCACDDRLQAEATAISQDPRTPPDIKIIAAATATSMAVLVCKYKPRS